MEKTGTSIMKFGDIAINLNLINYIKFDGNNIIICCGEGEKVRVYEGDKKYSIEYMNETDFAGKTPKQMYEFLILEWMNAVTYK